MQTDRDLIPSSFFLFWALRPFNGFLCAAWKLFVRRVRRQPKGLLELPLEVLTEVLKLLDWRSVLHLRQTCTLLSDATRAKSIWLSLFHAYNACHPCSPLNPERPTKLYQSQELEYLVLRRLSVEILGKTQTEFSPARTRRFPTGDSGVGALTLISGGRWLLTTSDTGSVSYYDLDTQNPVKRLLIPEQMEDFPDFSHGVLMAVDVDNESALLSFNLAMIMVRTACHSTPTQIAQVWHFIAFGVATPGEVYVPCYVALVDWAKAGLQNQSHPASLSYPRMIIYYPGIPDKVQLLPGDRLLVLSEEPDIRLYDLTPFDATTSIPPVDMPTWPTYPSPTWKSEIPHLRRDSLSQMFLCRHTNTLRLVFNTLHAVYGLVIPGNALLGQAPNLFRLMDFSVRNGPSFSFGYNSAIRHSRASLHLLDYSWPDGNPPGPSNVLTLKFDGDNRMERISAFDEGSGRMVDDLNDSTSTTTLLPSSSVLYEIFHIDDAQC
ncbi:hypothetical protein BDZ97DRAFT_1759167 [Flammula alnicola]|nr:hypothetical protein BDZ97DRAFT_1759167 [Flammula alnicola]